MCLPAEFLIHDGKFPHRSKSARNPLAPSRLITKLQAKKYNHNVTMVLELKSNSLTVKIMDDIVIDSKATLDRMLCSTTSIDNHPYFGAITGRLRRVSIMDQAALQCQMIPSLTRDPLLS